MALFCSTLSAKVANWLDGGHGRESSDQFSFAESFLTVEVFDRTTVSQRHAYLEHIDPPLPRLDIPTFGARTVVPRDRLSTSCASIIKTDTHLSHLPGLRNKSAYYHSEAERDRWRRRTLHQHSHLSDRRLRSPRPAAAHGQPHLLTRLRTRWDGWPTPSERRVCGERSGIARAAGNATSCGQSWCKGGASALPSYSLP